MKKIKISAVSYLNTKPFLYGIFQSPVASVIDLQLDIPSVCAKRLQRGEVDLGLVPVAVIPELSSPHLVSDYCIGAVGKVKTVCIYSDCPIEQLTHIYLDIHSRTSVELAKILLDEYWQLNPILLPTQKDLLPPIGGTTGALLIGDKTAGLEQQFAYTYDLGEAWLKHTGLPFVFAAWVSNYPLSETFIQAFNQALAQGIARIPELIYLLPPPHPTFDLKDYFTHNISYTLDDSKKQALSLFLEKMMQKHVPALSKMTIR